MNHLSTEIGDPATADAAPVDDLVIVRGLTKRFPIRTGLFGGPQRVVHAVENVGFSVRRGEILGLVGESGSGKSTTGRLVLRLLEPTAGSVQFDGQDLLRLSGAQLRAARKHMQIIFQDPYASLNPRMTVGSTLEEPFIVHGMHRKSERRERAAALLERVGLGPEAMRRYPHEFSGGQRQRVGIARALALDPKFIVADEPVSSLDVSIQAQIINLLAELQQERGISMLFIAHDLNMVRHICNRVAVMHLGRIVEMADADALFAEPLHPYTKALLDAIPIPDPTVARRKTVLEGEVPNPIDLPPGCRFYSRCPNRIDDCQREDPELREVRPGRWVACALVS